MSDTNAPEASAPQAELTAPARKARKVRSGRVTSAKMNKTITVVVERRERHPLYSKMITKQTKFHAHDENNEAREGDTVRMVETRPLSRTKRWRLLEIVARAPSADTTGGSGV